MTTATSRRTEAKAAAGRMAASATADRNSFKSRAADAARRVKAGTATMADADTLTQWQGMTAGARMRERQAAADALATLTALRRERQLSAAEQTAMTDAAAILAEAERLAAKSGRSRGRYVAADADRMTSVELSTLAARAARAELAARVKAHGYRMTDAERAETLTGLESAIIVAALERAVRVESAALANLCARIFRGAYGTTAADARAAALERSAVTRTAVIAERASAAIMPRWDAVYDRDVAPDVIRGMTARTLDNQRDRWAAWLRNAAKQELARIGAQVKAERASEDDARTPAVKASDAAASVASLAGRFLLAGRPIRKAERSALEALLDGLTHRERAALRGSTRAVESNRAARGRTALAERWPTLAAAREDFALAGAAAERTADDDAMANTGPVPLVPSGPLRGPFLPVCGPVTARMAGYVSATPAMPAVPDYYSPGRPLPATRGTRARCGGRATLPMMPPHRGWIAAHPSAARAAVKGARTRAAIMAAPQVRVTAKTARLAVHRDMIELARMAAEIGRATGRTAEARATVAWLTADVTGDGMPRSPRAIRAALNMAASLPPAPDISAAVVIGPPSRPTYTPGCPTEAPERTAMRDAAERARARATASFTDPRAK